MLSGVFMHRAGRSQKHCPISPAEWAFLRSELPVCQTAGYGKLSPGFEAALWVLERVSSGDWKLAVKTETMNVSHLDRPAFCGRKGKVPSSVHFLSFLEIEYLHWIRTTKFIQSITHHTVVLNLHVFTYFLTPVLAFWASSTIQMQCL